MVIANVNSLVDIDRGLISPRIFSEHGHLPGRAGADFRSLLALPLPRNPDSQARRLHDYIHGRGSCHRRP